MVLKTKQLLNTVLKSEYEMVIMNTVRVDVNAYLLVFMSVGERLIKP